MTPTIKSVKLLFFNEALLKEVNKETRKRIVRMAAYTRKVAKNSIKRGGRSIPGKPPRSRVGLLKKHIYFWWDKKGEYADIGPAALIGTSGPKDTPEVLESGGRGVKPRPYMGPALDEVKAKADTLFS